MSALREVLRVDKSIRNSVFSSEEDADLPPAESTPATLPRLHGLATLQRSIRGSTADAEDILQRPHKTASLKSNTVATK